MSYNQQGGYNPNAYNPQMQNPDVPPPPGVISYQPGYGPQQPQMIPMNTYVPNDQQQYGGQPQYGQQQYGGHMGGPQPIMMQPGMVPGQAAMWMPMPQPIQGVPAGLEYLTQVDTIIIKQLFEVLELITDFETKNKYILKNANGEQVYYAFEESNCCERQCCGPQRGFTMHVTDNFKREVLTLRRPFKCCGGGCSGLCAGCDCCAQECTIEAPPGNIIGYVKQRTSCCSSSFHIMDESHNKILKIDGVCCCLMCFCQDKEFSVTTMENEHIGQITKKWSGCLREAYTDADVFSVTFPMDLNAKMKAILLGATFLIDFMEFEQTSQKNNI